MRTDVSIFHLRLSLFRVSAENQLFNEPLLLERLEGFHTSLLPILSPETGGRVRGVALH